MLLRGQAPGLDEVPTWIARVAPDRASRAPELLLNEAMYWTRTGRHDEARRRLECVLELSDADGELAAHARRVLAALP